MSVKTVLVLALLLCIANSVTLVQLLGLTSLLQDLAKLPQKVNQTGPASTAYMLDPSIHTFLKQYKTRTEFCNYKCPNPLNLPCFLLFGCNIHIRNFIMLFFLPLFMLAFTGLCCGKGVWTFSCWMEYLATVTGVRLLVWAIGRCAGEGKQGEGKEGENDKQSEEDPNNEEIKGTKTDNGNIQTCERLQNRQSTPSQQ